tara:strand:+ start:8870 stop:9526 length:657 start_codon:yes stop_codon:yes gene_type:complete
MAKRFTDTEKWKKGFVRNLPPAYKLLWLYMLDDCDNAGVWQVEVEVASIRLAVKVNENEALKLFGNNVISFGEGTKWFIKEFVKFQQGVNHISELNDNSNPHKSILRIVEQYNLLSLEDNPIVKVEALKTNKTTKRFKKPTQEEVLKYCIERSNSVEGNKFYNFYESNGWKVGKNPMKDWMACVRTWESNSFEVTSKTKTENQLNSWQKAREIINKTK